MAMRPPPSPGPNRSRGPPPSPSTQGHRLQEPQSPNPNSGASSAPSPMSRLLTPPRFALPSVEAGQNDRELVYTTDQTSVFRSPFMPQMAEFGALSDASPTPALSPMNPTGGNTGVDPKVLSGICKTAGIQLPPSGKSPTKSQAAIFYQALNSPQAAAPILGPMCRSSPPRTGLHERDGSDTEGVTGGLGLDIDNRNSELCRSTPRLQYTFGPPLGGEWKQIPREDPTPIKQTEQEPMAERDAPDTDVKDVATKKLTFKNQTKPRPKIAKRTGPSPSKNQQNTPNKKKKGCNCARSKCLKLYCECFKAGVLCNVEECSCEDCHNNKEHEDELKAVKQKLIEKNPAAFERRRVQKDSSISPMDKAKMGAAYRFCCSCSKSSCEKNYCECYKAGTGCEPWCKCSNCRNPHGTRDFAVMNSRPESDDGPKGAINLASLANDDSDALSGSHKQQGFTAMDTEDADMDVGQQQSHADDMSISDVAPAAIAATSATMQAAY